MTLRPATWPHCCSGRFGQALPVVPCPAKISLERLGFRSGEGDGGPSFGQGRQPGAQPLALGGECREWGVSGKVPDFRLPATLKLVYLPPLRYPE
jgi:hypothetical protein